MDRPFLTRLLHQTLKGLFLGVMEANGQNRNGEMKLGNEILKIKG